MSDTKVIYIASPYTKGDAAVNVRVQIDAADILLDMGGAPIAPLLSHFWHLVHPRSYESWFIMDKAFIEKSDALLRIPGPSSGADREVIWAEEMGKPVLHDLMAAGLFLQDTLMANEVLSSKMNAFETNVRLMHKIQGFS